ncbi:hypothetical protein PV11_09595 [Exophiala sideris]|uniref:Tyrosine specific protein phosphatases domain-containing protein n=1 Tax=Exophiala sideris TaxID=1016849 RepID=A0A0D1VP41_9EURO|nr:hypothetical protein PV11_09595 [Exophiala sideris]
MATHSNEHHIPNPEKPYQPYMDVRPPTQAGFSPESGAPLKEQEIEADEREARAERESTPEPKDFNIAFPGHLPTPPFIHIQGVPNFRDLGGYQCQPSSTASSTQDGTTYTLRRGLLYRCAHPTHLTPQGAEYLTQKLDVHDMYDLRSAPEIARLANTVATTGKDVYPLADPSTGCVDKVPGLTRHFTPVYQSEDYGPVALAKKLQWYTTVHSHDENAGFAYSEGFVKAYRDIATHGAGAYTTMFRHLLERPDEPLIFHCTAGKDRTGVFGGMIMKLVGVDEEVICWEYALTEPGLGEWRQQFIERISAGGLGQGGIASSNSSGGERPGMSREEAARICGSRAGNMRAFLKVVLLGEFGGVENYLRKQCGFSDQEIGKLRDNLIARVKEEDVVRPVDVPGWTPDGGVQD